MRFWRVGRLWIDTTKNTTVKQQRNKGSLYGSSNFPTRSTLELAQVA